VLCQSQQNFILPRVLADDKVAFPMSEFFPVVDGRIPLFDAATEFLFVLHQAEIHIIIQGLCAGDLIFTEDLIPECAAPTGIQRPAIFTDMMINILQECGFLKPFIMSAAVGTVLFIGLLPL
jgi:hypothetical protein